MSVLRSWLVGTCVIAAGGTAAAQSVTGSIDGLVVDPTAGVLAGVAITAMQHDTGVTRATVSDDRGAFSLPVLPAGTYRLSAELAGFETRRIDLRIFVGQRVDVRVELAVAGVDQSVVVLAERPVLETTRSHVSAIVDEHAVRNLPVNGRNFLDFTLLTPGVTRDVRGGDLSFAGQRGTLNSVIVDGVDNNNTFAGQALGRTGTGRAPYQFSADAVQEFQVNSSSYSAEYGRAGAGIISVVTRSGTNQLRGSLFEFYRDIALNATNAINELNGQPKSPYHYHQFGGTLGGPLRRNRDFFFANYDGQRNRQSNLVFLNLPSDTPTDPLTQAGIAMLQPLAFSWDRGLNQDVFLIKTDHRVRDAHALTFRYNHQDFAGDNYENGGPQNAFEHTGPSLVRTRTLSATWTNVTRSRLFNELRWHYARDHEPGEANSENPEAVVNQGALVLLIGRNNFSPRSSTIDRLQIADTVTAERGSHEFKGGFDLQIDRIRSYFPGFFNGSYTFRSLASFALGRPSAPNESYQQSFAGPGTSGPESQPDVSEISAFVQDAWRARPDLTLNVGLRYDLAKMDPPPATNPDPQLAAAGVDTGRFDPDVNNVAPRVGVAWHPSGRSYVVRAGWGVYYGRIPAVLVAATNNNGVNVISVTLTGAAVPTYPEKLTEIPAGAAPPPNIFYIDKDFSSSKVTQASGAIEWALGARTTLAASYLFAGGSSLARSIDRNLGPLGERTVTVEGTGEVLRYHFFGTPRAFTGFQRVIAFESNAESNYNGFTLDLNRRFAAGSMLRASYTLSRVVDTVPDATAVAPGNIGDDLKYASNPLDFEVDRTVGANDQPHRFVTSGVYGVRRWWFSGIFTAQSGQPYSARINGDLNGDGNTRNDLAPGTTRNALRLPAIVQLDLRVARDVPLGSRATAQLIVEGFNVLNRDNINGVVMAKYALSGAILRPNLLFGGPMTSAGERIIQLACRVTF
jgi:outer membrane receptor protein involved in Fe transport